MEESLSCILRGSSGSVRRSIQQTVTLVSVLFPMTVSVSRSPGVRRCRRTRLVFVRSVSVNASFAPLTVFSVSGGDGLRFSPVFTSQPSAFPLFGNKITQKPFTSSSAACCVDSGSFTDAHQTPPCSARVYKTSSRASSVICASGRTTCSAISPPDVSPSRNNTVSSCPPQRTFRVSKSAASSNCAVSARPSTIAFHLVGIIVPPSGKNYTAAFAYAA